MGSLKKLTSKDVGDKAELMAEHFLKKQGVTIIEKNYRDSPGEIDLIADDLGTLVFIEVKFRKSTNFGQPFETVTRVKQQKIIRTAESYLQKHPQLANKACRFDVISIQDQDINWIPNAFDTTT